MTTFIRPSEQQEESKSRFTFIRPAEEELASKPKYDMKLEGWEAELASKHPNLYGAVGAGLELFPFARYALPSNRAEFESLEQHDKNQALILNAGEVGLWVFGGALLRQAGKATKGAVNLGKKAIGVKRLPVEDAIKGIESLTQKGFEYKPFSYESSMKSLLKGSKYKLTDKEANIVFEAVSTGNRKILKDFEYTRKWKNTKLSDAWSKVVKETHELYGGRKIADDLFPKLSERSLRHNHYQKQFKAALEKEVFGSTHQAGGMVDGAFKALSHRFFGKGWGYADLSSEDAANMLYHALAHPQRMRKLARPGRGGWPAILSPTRVIYGQGELAFNTFSKIYKPITKAHGRVNSYYFSRITEFQAMLQQSKLGKLIKKDTGEFRFKPAYAAVHETRAYDHIVAMDQLMARVPKGTNERSAKVMAEIKAAKEALEQKLGKDNPARAITEVWYRFADNMYGEFLTHRIRDRFTVAGLTEYGQRALDATMRTAERDIALNFSSYASKNHVEKVKFIDELLSRFRSKLEIGEDVNVHPWFVKEGKDLQKTVKKLEYQLQRGNKKGQVPNYLENYAARLSEKSDALMTDWSNSIARNPRAFMTKARKQKLRTESPVDFTTMIEARVRAQGKEMFLYREMEDVMKHTSKLPVLWQEYTEHFLNRAMGRPSIHDYKVARFIEDTFGGKWDEARVARVAKTVNDLTYLGGIGFKPFSALRNLFQPLVTVPADLGGIKDYWHLLRGARRAMQKETHTYLRSIGAIGEYLPELSMRPRALPYGKRVMVGGKERALPNLDRLRDVGLWMFRGSDRWNRYVTGGAALNKWETAVKKVGHINSKNMRVFMKKAGLYGREDYVKAELQDLLMRGRIREARDLFVKDVIADTQFLYGGLEAPIATSKWGGVGKTGMIFQSWWMNYGNLISKWLTTGKADVKAQRAINAYLSSAIAYSLMEKIWGSGTASRTTFMGPFPSEVNEFLIPPAWTPIYRSMRIIAAGASLDSEEALKQTKAALGSVPVLIPGGLQIKSMAQGASKEGLKGLIKSIIRYRGPDK